MSVSIIIPTFNESGCIADTIRSIRAQRPSEIIVVDGGSTDATLAQAQEANRVMTAPPGRSFQMNRGASVASGESLLFLHADCRLETGALDGLERTLARPDVVAGCFSMRVEAAGWAFLSINACASARVRLTGIVYGDQGLFLKRDLFMRLGGFPAVTFMEDVFLAQRLARLGRVVVRNERIFVSPRRWRKVGLVRQTLTNWTLTALAIYGIPPDRLAEFYPRVR